MKNLLVISFIFFFLLLGCQKTPNEVLLDSQIPPDEQLIKIKADDLATEFTRGRRRDTSNDADNKFSGKWLKVSGTITQISDDGDAFGYGITLYTFAGNPKVACIGNFQENEPKVLPKKDQEIIVIGKLVSSGTAQTLYLNPCKFIK